MKDLKRIISQPLKVGGILGGVFGFISDFLQPLAEIGYVIAAICFVIILLSLIIKAIPPADNLLYKKYSTIWYGPLFVTLITFTAILSTANYLSLHYGNNQEGILATNSTFINKIQKNLIQIETSLKTIEESQKQAHKNLETIKQEQKNISQTIHLNIEQLKQSILSGNIDAVKQFHNQGGDLHSLKSPPPGYTGWNEAIIVSLVKNQNKNTVEILDYVLNNTSLDPNSLYPVNNFGNGISDAYLSMLQADNMTKNEAYLSSSKICTEKHRALLKLDREKARNFDAMSCIKENSTTFLKDKKLNFDDFSELKSAMNSLINEARYAENMEVVKYLTERGAATNNEGLIILKSGKKIKVPFFP